VGGTVIDDDDARAAALLDDRLLGQAFDCLAQRVGLVVADEQDGEREVIGISGPLPHEERDDGDDDRADGIARQLKKARVPEQRDQAHHIHGIEQIERAHRDHSIASNSATASPSATWAESSRGAAMAFPITARTRSTTLVATWAPGVSGNPISTEVALSAPTKSASRSVSTMASTAIRNAR